MLCYIKTDKDVGSERYQTCRLKDMNELKAIKESGLKIDWYPRFASVTFYEDGNQINKTFNVTKKSFERFLRDNQ